MHARTTTLEDAQTMHLHCVFHVQRCYVQWLQSHAVLHWIWCLTNHLDCMSSVFHHGYAPHRHVSNTLKALAVIEIPMEVNVVIMS